MSHHAEVLPFGVDDALLTKQPAGRATALPRDASWPLPLAPRGRWCIIHTADLSQASDLWPLVSFQDAVGDAVGMPRYLGRAPWGRQAYWTVAYVPANACGYRLTTMHPTAARPRATLQFRPVSQPVASMLILTRRWRTLPSLLRLAFTGQSRRARTLLVSLAGAMHGPESYAEWASCFDTWPTQPPDDLKRATIAALVFARTPGAAADATLQSLAAQGVPLPHTVLVGAQSAGWRLAAAALPGDYVAVLQAGEVMPPHAAWLAGAELDRLGRPPVALADEDQVGADGARLDPIFRPEPNRTLMLSGTQSRGVWFVRRDVLLAYAAETASDPGWAEQLRLDLWLRRYERGAGASRRLPFVLTHRRGDAEAMPAAALAGTVDAHLARAGLPLAASAEYPVRLRSTQAAQARVSILIPSTLRTPLVLRCILSVLQETRCADLELVVGVSQAGPLDEVQRDAAERIAADPRARVVHLPRAAFNFSGVCNALAAVSTGDFILLLNDDVSAIAPGWLDEMVAHCADPAVAIVGAKLLYPDQTVQHGGIIMGLAGLCDHAHRHLPAASPGYAARAILAQELSAVTGACLLVRRSVYEQVGGLDEGYPSAFNDVDFCLRVRELGHTIVFAPAAELIHHEMQTYGSHYSGDRAPFETEEIARMRRRWAAVVAADPYHNPNLDLGTGREWHLAFPPRHRRPALIAG